MCFVSGLQHFWCSSRSFKGWMYFLVELQFQFYSCSGTEEKLFSDNWLPSFWRIAFLWVEWYPIMYAEKYYWGTKGELNLGLLWPWHLQWSSAVLMGSYCPQCWKSIDRLTECLLGICTGWTMFSSSQKIKMFQFSKRLSRKELMCSNNNALLSECNMRKDKKMDNYHSTGVKCDMICAHFVI